MKQVERMVILFIALVVLMPVGRLLAQDTYSVVPVTGFNQDVVAENSPSKSYTTAAFDNGANVFYAHGFGSCLYGLPADKSIVSPSGPTYLLQP